MNVSRQVFDPSSPQCGLQTAQNAVRTCTVRCASSRPASVASRKYGQDTSAQSGNLCCCRSVTATLYGLDYLHCERIDRLSTGIVMNWLLSGAVNWTLCKALKAFLAVWPRQV